MNLWAVIPVKSLHAGKSRLAGSVSDAERKKLNRMLYLHMFETVNTVLAGSNIAVISKDRDVLAHARQRGAHALLEHEPADLNLALAQACRYAGENGARTVMVLACDLPLIADADIKALCEVLPNGTSCAIAPDRAGEGTNALAVPASMNNVFRFGPGSFAAHQNELQRHGLQPSILRRPAFAFDLDIPDDYALLQRQRGKGR